MAPATGGYSVVGALHDIRVVAIGLRRRESLWLSIVIGSIRQSM
jgi:hypothetical protein